MFKRVIALDVDWVVEEFATSGLKQRFKSYLTRHGISCVVRSVKYEMNDGDLAQYEVMFEGDAAAEKRFDDKCNKALGAPYSKPEA